MAETPAKGIVIWLTGPIGSGKDYAADFLHRQLGLPKVGFSDVIRATGALELGWGGDAPRSELTRFANERRAADPEFWGRKVGEQVNRCRDSVTGELLAVVSGVRNLGDLCGLRSALPPGVLKPTAILAPAWLRWERVRSRARPGDPTTIEEFMNLDDRERGLGQPETGLRIDDCVAQVPLSLRFNNDSEPARLERFCTSLLLGRE
jgi:hypothetical protein